MANTNKIYDVLKKGLSFNPNMEQIEALKCLGDFITSSSNDFFILSGPAGSGKTSLVKSLVDYFEESGTGYYLASPTGRSAHILGRKTGSYAATMHHLLFIPEFNDKTMQICFTPKSNKAHDSIRYFIVDEASMISDKSNQEGMFVQDVSLLGQLIRFAKKGNPQNKLILIGDRYQLPPVGSNESPALSVDYLSSRYKLKGNSFELSQVERQSHDSYILEMACQILQSIKDRKSYTFNSFKAYSSFSASINKYLADYSDENSDHSIMIAFANSQVNAMNTWARNFRYNYKNHHNIMPDELMICNHNVMVGESTLFKGNHFVVRKTWKPEEFAGLHFINAKIEFTDLYNEKVVENTKIMIESVTAPDGSIPIEKEKQLLHEAYKRNPRFRESRNPYDDAFVSAVRARYGYALTCHKAQGGEWNNVYLHPGFRKDDLRRLYTAITRASQNLYSWFDGKNGLTF